MKVCIVTWYNSQNYGTCLQGFALYHYLKKKGCDTILLNTKIYIDYKDIRYLPIIFSRIKERIENYIKEGGNILEQRKIKKKYQKAFVKREKLFSEFKKNNIKVTLPLSDEKLMELSNDMDVFVTGSDQIWNPYFLKTRYLLDFVDNNTKKVAYASSFGVAELPNEMVKQKYEKLLSRFDAISVREQAGVDICKEMGIFNVKRVVDPTLLISKDEWENILDVNQIDRTVTQEEYILCYFVGNNLEYWEYIAEVSRRTSYKIKVIPFSNGAYSRGYDLCIETGPLEFIRLIMNAKYVYTDSFHCTCFSIIFNKQFTVLNRFSDEDSKSQNSRLNELFEFLNMENRISKFYDIVLPGEAYIDYQKINAKMIDLRSKSEEYLLRYLGL